MKETTIYKVNVKLKDPNEDTRYIKTIQAKLPKQECLQGMCNSRGSLQWHTQQQAPTKKKPPRDAQL
jgi:hypothetical protein